MAGSQPASQAQSGGASQRDEFRHFSEMRRARPWETDFAIAPCPNTGTNSRKCPTQSISATGVGVDTRMPDVNPSQKKQILTARFEDVVLHKTNFLSVSVSVRLALACMVSIL